MLDLITVLKVVGAGLSALFVSARLGYFIADTRHRLAARSIKHSERDAQFSQSFSEGEITESLRKYVRQDCAQLDPSHESDLQRVADIREGIFKALDRFVEYPQRRHALVLADSGMGKTSLCLNYFDHLRRKRVPACLVTLARPDALKQISRIKNKRDTICILDALDEDAAAIQDAQDRLQRIFKETADFKSVIITCRSQFFRDQTSIPSETGVLVVGPRPGGAGATYKVYHLFLLPFTRRQIESFLIRQFPLWNPFNFSSRSKSRALVSRIPELSVRPMLLDLLPNLIREKSDARELYDLYTYMVDKWCDREEGWIGRDVLITISEALAVKIHSRMMSGGGDRISLEELHGTAHELGVPIEDWKNLSARSLLNRDIEGRIKFAHRSILEYFIVRAVVDGYDDPLNDKWTDVMRELFVSWGYTEDGESGLDRARDILGRDLSKTTLIPLSEAPREPGIITQQDIAVICASARSRGGRRNAPVRWRSDSIKLKDLGGSYTIFDIDSNLEWAIVDFAAVHREGLLDQFVCPLGDQLSLLSIHPEYRLPSLDEMLSIVEGCEAVNRTEIIPDRFLYILGDMAGDRRYVILSFQEENNSSLSLLDARKAIVGTSRRAWLYEAGLHTDTNAFRNLKVAALRVRKERENWQEFDFWGMNQMSKRHSKN